MTTKTFDAETRATELQGQKLPALRALYEQATGEASRCPNKTYAEPDVMRS